MALTDHSLLIISAFSGNQLRKTGFTSQNRVEEASSTYLAELGAGRFRPFLEPASVSESLFSTPWSYVKASQVTHTMKSGGVPVASLGQHGRP